MALPVRLGTLRARLIQAWRDRAVILKALSFATVGLINTVVDASIFFLLLAYATSSLIVANVAAWLVAVTGSYVMNSLTTFSAETKGQLRLKDYGGFVGTGLVAVIATTTTVVIAAQFMPVWAAKGMAVLVSFAVNFSINHLVVFRPRPNAASEPR